MQHGVIWEWHENVSHLTWHETTYYGHDMYIIFEMYIINLKQTQPIHKITSAPSAVTWRQVERSQSSPPQERSKGGSTWAA